MPGALSRLIRRLRGSTSHGRLVDLAATEAEQNQVSIANGTAMKKSVQKSQSAIDVTASSTGPLKQQLDLKTVDIKKQKKKEEKQQKKAAKEEKNSSTPVLKTKSGKKSKRCKYYFEEEQVEIVDINNPFEFYKLRALNVAAALQVQAEIEKIVAMDVRRVPEEELIATAADTNTKYQWYSHPSHGHRLLMRILPAHEGSSPPPRFVVVTGKRVDDENEENIAAEIEELIEACDNPDGKQCVEVLLDVAWRSTEIASLQQILDVFRPTVKHVSLDGIIFEMILAYLSPLVATLNHWYAFLCFCLTIKAPKMHWPMAPGIGTHQHLAPPSGQSFNPNSSLPGHFFPSVVSFCVRTWATIPESTHLVRSFDYKVSADRVIANRTLIDHIEVRVIPVEGGDEGSTEFINGVFNFRCWAGSCGWDYRYSYKRLAQITVSTTNDGESIVATATANQQQTDEEKVNTTETVNDPVEPPASISAVYATTNAPAITIT